MSDIFISYARPNEALAMQAGEALRAAGYRVWRDDELPAHRAYSDVIEERIKSAKAVLVLWSNDAVRSLTAAPRTSRPLSTEVGRSSVREVVTSGHTTMSSPDTAPSAISRTAIAPSASFSSMVPSRRDVDTLRNEPDRMSVSASQRHVSTGSEVTGSTAKRGPAAASDGTHGPE